MNHQKSGIQIIGNACNRELVLAVCRFVKFLKRQYDFPVLLKIIFCDSSRVLCPTDQDVCVSVLWVPEDSKMIYRYPYILCSAGDYVQDRAKLGRDNALPSYIHDIAKHILRYQNWIAKNSVNVYAVNIKATDLLNQYSETREHP